MTSAPAASVAREPSAMPFDGSAPDRRGSWVPTMGMVTTRIMELRKRRGLMIALIVVNIGIPTVFLTIRLIAHAADPKAYGPAGGSGTFSGLVAGVLFIFGFIVAATLGATAGTADVTEGMFRHLVVTGRSRLAIYFARIPAGLAIIVPMVAAGFTIVCAVCVFAAPTTLDYQGVHLPLGLSKSGFQSWAVSHPQRVICDFPFRGPLTLNVNCGGPGGGGVIISKSPGQTGPPTNPTASTPAQMRAAAKLIARQDYADYSQTFLTPSNMLMVKSGLWVELEAIIGFIVGLGLASLIGQRTVAVILMFVFELILTPLLATHVIPHFINVQRGLVGLATAHLEPHALPQVFGHGGGPNALIPESTTVVICVIVAWLVGWTALGAWKMVRRDA